LPPALPGFDTHPLFDALEDTFNPDSGKHCSWKNYFSDLPFLGFWYKFAATHIFGNFHTVLDFVVDCRENTLPTVSIIDPPFALADDHPSYDVARGEKFMGLMIDALTHSESWKNTALVLLYDENGGFFDHVVPPSKFSPEGPPVEGDTPFGFRVPAIVLSPFAKTGAVKTVFDHTSIMKSIALRWNVDFPAAKYGTRWAAAPDIWSTCFDFTREPIPVGNYTQSEVFKDSPWEQDVHNVVTQPPGGVLSSLERVFLLPTHAPLDNRSKLFDLLNDTEREVVRLKRLVGKKFGE
jgi:hypothetical protein